jgi:hypothetical protein
MDLFYNSIPQEKTRENPARRHGHVYRSSRIPSNRACT